MTIENIITWYSASCMWESTELNQTKFIVMHTQSLMVGGNRSILEPCITMQHLPFMGFMYISSLMYEDMMCCDVCGWWNLCLVCFFHPCRLSSQRSTSSHIQMAPVTWTCRSSGVGPKWSGKQHTHTHTHIGSPVSQRSSNCAHVWVKILPPQILIF